MRISTVKLAGALIAIFGSIGAATAQATATANASANIIAPLTLIWIKDMNFGDMIAGATSGIVRIVADPGDQIGSIDTSLLGGVTHLGGNTQGSFQADGEADRLLVVTLPASITVVSGANSMLVDDFRSTPVPRLGQNTGIPTRLRIGVQAALHVAANQPVGVYANTFDVSVSYN